MTLTQVPAPVGERDHRSDRPQRRLRSVDAFRGAVLAMMLLTPATGSPSTFPVLHHAAWNGLTISDVVFPAFLVTSGLSLAFLLRPPVLPATKWRLVRRFALLVIVGLVYNAYGTTGFDLDRLRFTGVLQTIGIAGALAATAVVVSRRHDGTDRTGTLAALAVALPAGYGLGLWALDGCTPVAACSPYLRLDTTVLGPGHVYGAGTLGWDPEGVAASVTATSLVLIGYLASRQLHTHHDRMRSAATALAGTGAVLIGVGRLLDSVQPVNKRLFTPSFVAVGAGIALCAFAAFVLFLDSRPVPRRGVEATTWPLVALGRNALVVYVGERLLLRTAEMIHVGDRTVENWLLDDVLPLGRPGVHLAYTGLLLGVVATTTALLHRHRRYLAL